MSFEFILGMLVFFILTYLAINQQGQKQNQLITLIKNFADQFSQDKGFIKQISKMIDVNFQNKALTPLPQQIITKEQTSHSNCIIRHYKKFFIAYYSQETGISYKNSDKIKCQNNEILYAKFINNDFDSFTGEGFQFKVTYDQNYNPTYELYEGQFLNGLRHGKGKLYGQKSENVDYEGEWKNNEMVSNCQDKQQMDQLENKSQIKVVIREGDKIINQNIKHKENQRRVEYWIKFNQLISENDIAILKSNRWLTSSIIDSFALYLNIQMEEQYFNIDHNNRRLALRQVFIPSQIFTSMQNNQKNINQQIFQTHFLEYKRIEYKIEKIFRRVNFIVNRSNTHWFLIQLNLENYEMIVMDSIRSKENQYRFAQNILNQIFDNRIKKITLSDQCHSQKNGYDCGPYTCLHMLEISEVQLKLKNPSQMKDFLLQILKQD